MPAPLRRARSSALVALAFLLGLGVLPARAQELSRIYAVIQVSDNALDDHPVMVSFIQDGKILFQSEEFLTRSPNTVSVRSQESPAGMYDVRVEGDGIVTEVKRGIQHNAGGDTTLKFMVRPGEGVHTVEYAEGGLAREEVAARIAALEAEVAKLRGATQ